MITEAKLIINICKHYILSFFIYHSFISYYQFNIEIIIQI